MELDIPIKGVMTKKSRKELDRIFMKAWMDRFDLPLLNGKPEASVTAIALDLFWMYYSVDCLEVWRRLAEWYFKISTNPYPTSNQLKCPLVLIMHCRLDEMIDIIEEFLGHYDELFQGTKVFQPRTLKHLARHKVCMLARSLAPEAIRTLDLPKELDHYITSPFTQ